MNEEIFLHDWIKLPFVNRAWEERTQKQRLDVLRKHLPNFTAISSNSMTSPFLAARETLGRVVIDGTFDIDQPCCFLLFYERKYYIIHRRLLKWVINGGRIHKNELAQTLMQMWYSSWLIHDWGLMTANFLIDNELIKAVKDLIPKDLHLRVLTFKESEKRVIETFDYSKFLSRIEGTKNVV